MTESISSSKSVRENARGHDLAIAISRIIEKTRGKDIRILDLRSVTEVFDYFVIATCLLYTSPSPRDGLLSRMPSSA